MPANQGRTIHIQDLSRTGLPVRVRIEGRPERGETRRPPCDLHPPGDLDRVYYGGRPVTQMDADKLLRRYQAERTATAEDCDQATFALSSAVEFFWEILLRKGGAEGLRQRMGELAVTEQSLLDAMTQLSATPVQQEAAE